jgi:hypothetical protein
MVLEEHVRYFNIGHRASRAAAESIGDPKGWEVVGERVLGGLHHVYHLAA